MHLPKQAAPVQRTLVPAAKSSENNGVEPSILGGLLDPLLMILGQVLGGK
jgi:hypothetical protein